MPAEPHPPRFALDIHVAYDVTHTEAVLEAVCETIGRAPTLEAAPHIGALPHAPDVPDELRGRKAVMVDGIYRGHLQDGYALVSRLRTIATPLIDRTAPVDVR